MARLREGTQRPHVRSAGGGGQGDGRATPHAPGAELPVALHALHGARMRCRGGGGKSVQSILKQSPPLYRGAEHFSRSPCLPCVTAVSRAHAVCAAGAAASG